MKLKPANMQKSLEAPLNVYVHEIRENFLSKSFAMQVLWRQVYDNVQLANLWSFL